MRPYLFVSKARSLVLPAGTDSMNSLRFHTWYPVNLVDPHVTAFNVFNERVLISHAVPGGPACNGV
jgi:hypothetical protein